MAFQKLPVTFSGVHAMVAASTFSSSLNQYLKDVLSEGSAASLYSFIMFSNWRVLAMR